MVNGEVAALQEAQVILHKASIVTEARLLKIASVTGAQRRYADENDIGLTVMGLTGTPGYAGPYRQPYPGDAG